MLALYYHTKPARMSSRDHNNQTTRNREKINSSLTRSVYFCSRYICRLKIVRSKHHQVALKELPTETALLQQHERKGITLMQG